MRKTNKIVTVLILFLLINWGKGMATPIPSEIKSVVVFIFAEKEGKLFPNGTAFFVGVQNPADPKFSSVCLVTSKHVLQKPKTTDFYDKVFVRLNKHNGKSEMGPIPLFVTGKNKNLFIHSDPSVDIAVIPVLPDQNIFDFKILPDNMITTKEDFKKLKIREGSEVFLLECLLLILVQRRIIQ